MYQIRKTRTVPAVIVAGASAEDVVQITLLNDDHVAEELAYLVKKRKAVFGDNMM